MKPTFEQYKAMSPEQREIARELWPEVKGHFSATKGETVNQAHTPWKHDKYGQLNDVIGAPVIVWGLGLSHGGKTPETVANTALIVAAVNAHAANLARIAQLEGLAKAMLAFLTDPDADSFTADSIEVQIRAALKGE